MTPLEELRERAEEMLLSRPAETTPELSWLVAELERQKQVVLGLIDYLLATGH
ncbi:MAG TPA: hypothetical protein VG452_11660 [Egibacteraceae bacterium]|nr:hypothetical protein [Actinomycetota bacterium]HWB72865.1 hypothetical protein [Egibacteraceae bacterium]